MKALRFGVGFGVSPGHASGFISERFGDSRTLEPETRQSHTMTTRSDANSAQVSGVRKHEETLRNSLAHATLMVTRRGVHPDQRTRASEPLRIRSITCWSGRRISVTCSKCGAEMVLTSALLSSRDEQKGTVKCLQCGHTQQASGMGDILAAAFEADRQHYDMGDMGSALTWGLRKATTSAANMYRFVACSRCSLERLL